MPDCVPVTMMAAKQNQRTGYGRQIERHGKGKKLRLTRCGLRQKQGILVTGRQSSLFRVQTAHASCLQSHDTNRSPLCRLINPNAETAREILLAIHTHRSSLVGSHCRRNPKPRSLSSPFFHLNPQSPVPTQSNPAGNALTSRSDSDHRHGLRKSKLRRHTTAQCNFLCSNEQ